MPKEKSCSPSPVPDWRVITKPCWSFYWLLTSKRSRMDELSWGSEAVAAAVGAYTETTRFAFKMIHLLPPPPPHPPPTTRFTHQITQAAASPPAPPRRRGPRPRCRTWPNLQVKAGLALRAERHCSAPLGADSMLLCPQGTACGPGAQLRHPSHLTTSLH